MCRFWTTPSSGELVVSLIWWFELSSAREHQLVEIYQRPELLDNGSSPGESRSRL
jgi:hypothetical protein